MLVDLPLFFTEFMAGSGAESTDILERVTLISTKYTNFYTLCQLAAIQTAYTETQTCGGYKLSWRGLFNLPRVASSIYSMVIKLMQNDIYNAMIALGNLSATLLAYEFATATV